MDLDGILRREATRLAPLTVAITLTTDQLRELAREASMQPGRRLTLEVIVNGTWRVVGDMPR